MELIFIVIMSFIPLVLAGYFIISLFKLSNNNPFVALWLGVFCIGIWASIVQFFFPLNGVVIAICLFPCFLGIKQTYRAYGVWTQEDIKIRVTQGILVFTFLCIILASVTSIGLGNAYDTDLYHLQIIAWMKEYAIVPGLGNLHSRLAGSSLWYTISALFPSSVTIYLPMLMSAIFYMGIFGWIFSLLYKCQQKWQFVYLLTVTFLSIYYYGKNIFPHLYADPIALFLCVIAMYYFLSAFYDKQTFCRDNIILGLFFITLSFSIKPLAGISIVFACIVAILAWKKQMICWKDLLFAFSLPIVMGIIWVIQNIILSGYPIFPLTIFPLDVDWLMHTGSAKGHQIAVSGWARWPRSGYRLALESGISYWFPSWIQMHLANKYFWRVILLPLFLSTFLWAYLFIKKIDKIMFMFFIWIVLSIVYWFNIFPDPRFGREFFWLLLAVGCAFLSILHQNNKYITFIYSKQNIVILLCIVLLAWAQIQSLKKLGYLAWDAEPWPGRLVERIIMSTEKGEPLFYMWKPIDDDRCGGAPVPCTPYLNQSLQRRNPHDLGEGFRMIQ